MVSQVAPAAVCTMIHPSSQGIGWPKLLPDGLRLGCVAPDEGVHGLRRHHGRGHALGDRNVDVLALAGVALHEQRHGRRRRAVQAALVLSLETTVFQRLPALRPADAHYQPHGVVDDLLPRVPAVRPRLPEGSDRCQHQPGIDRLQRLVSQTQLVQVSRPELSTTTSTWGTSSRNSCRPACVLRLMVADFLFRFMARKNRLFSGAGRPRRTAASCVGPRRTRLQLQHVRAVVGQQPRAERPGDVLAQVQDPSRRPAARAASAWGKWRQWSSRQS